MLSPWLIAPAGHSPSHVPHMMQSSEITYAIISLVYRDEELRWFARDLGSRWGTMIERPGMDEPLVVALPLDEQVEEPLDVEVLPGDTLVLGSTRFEVQRFQRGE